MTDVDEFLEHYGVRGMQWGQRKTGSSRKGKADKAARLAERRPTRGNIRTAQRAQIQADRTVLGIRRRPMSDVAKARTTVIGAAAVVGVLAYAGGRAIGNALVSRSSSAFETLLR